MNEQRDKNALTFFIRLFREMCAAEDIGVDQQPGVNLPYFMEWVHRHLDIRGCDQFADVTDTATYELVKALAVDDPRRIANLWWPICLCNRKATPTYELESISWSLMLRYKDGTLLPITCHMTPRDERITDAGLLSQLQERQALFFNEILNHGIDRLHESGKNMGGVQVFDILIGAFKQIIDQIKPEYREQLTEYLTMIINMIYPIFRPKIVVPDSARGAGPARGGFG